jgi:hypothetical protein
LPAKNSFQALNPIKRQIQAKYLPSSCIRQIGAVKTTLLSLKSASGTAQLPAWRSQFNWLAVQAIRDVSRKAKTR